MKISLPLQIGLISLVVSGPCFADFADARTVEHSLRENAQILVNSQGLAQHDLSLRGSSYSGVGVAVNGLNLKSPFSAHQNAEIPFLNYLISKPVAASGANNISGHLVGTAQFNLQPTAPNVQAMAGMGTPERVNANVLGQLQASDSLSTSGFIDYEKANEIDYDENDLDRVAGGLSGQYLTQTEWVLDLVGGYQQKAFGAQGYYGIPANQSAEQKIDDGLLLFSATKGDLDDAYLRAGTSFRQLEDHYSTVGYAHDVRSQYGTAMVEARTMEIQQVALNIRGDLEIEGVDGSTGSSDRTRGSILLMPEARFEKMTLKLGLNSVIQTSESTEFLPQAGIDWFITDNSTVFAAYTENIQQPDYQTLNSNAALQQQKARNSEVGFRQFLTESMDWKLASFYRRLEHASDWLNGTATGLGHIDIAGMDAAFNWYPSAETELKLYYQWLHKDNEAKNGLYETDYPEHLAALFGQWRFLPEFLLFGQQDLRYQTENDLRTSSDFGANASLGLHYDPRFAKNVRLSFLVENLWGTTFQSIPGLKPRPISVFTGLTVAW